MNLFERFLIYSKPFSNIRKFDSYFNRVRRRYYRYICRLLVREAKYYE